jgi:murein DD-endopeptidase MepM/ murein hydrolase activator NlpD
MTRSKIWLADVRRPLRQVLLLTASLAGVGCGDEAGFERAEVGFAREPLITPISEISQRGMLVKFWKVENPTGITLSRVVNLAACSRTVLYAVERVSGSNVTYPLYFSKNSGQTFTRVLNESGANVVLSTPQIACDRAMLMFLNREGGARWTTTRTSGNFANAAVSISQSTEVGRIQGGDGTFYGVRSGTGPGGTNEIFLATNRSVAAEPRWEATPIGTTAADQIAGTGAYKTGAGSVPVANTLAWPRRAYALSSTGVVTTNDTLLAGGSTWTALNTGSERYTALTVADPNTLYALQTRNGIVELNQITTEETNCADLTDNDANGLKDTEDPKCFQVRADAYCADKANGKYCASRYQPPFYLDQSNQSTSLVTCSGGKATIKAGVCTTVSPGNDKLETAETMTPAEPTGYARWCNIHRSDGTWDTAWTGTKPCDTLLAANPGAQIVRAGLYSTSGSNNVLANCNNGWSTLKGTGTAPISAVYNGVGHTNNRCIFTISPTALPIFERMFTNVPGRGANPFVYEYGTAANPIQLSQYGGTGTALAIDRFGNDVGGGEQAYDHQLDEGRPVYAVAGGFVVNPNGARERDISASNVLGTPFQTDLVIQYSVGTDATYRETFVVYYAHLRKHLVTSGQTVKAGQIVGYVGLIGHTGTNGTPPSSGYAHLHSSVSRASNINAYSTGNWASGYHPSTALTSFIYQVAAIDALGWAAPMGIDPWGYKEMDTPTGVGALLGFGAWSIDLFKDGQDFTYP